MKKKTLFTLSVTALLLSSCGGGSKKNAIKKIYDAFAEYGNCVALINDENNVSYYNENAMFTEYPEEYAEYGYVDTGVIRNGDQGVFEYTVSENSIVLGSNVSTSPTLSVEDLYYTPADLFGMDASIWKAVGSNSTKFYTDSMDFFTAFLGLVGGSGYENDVDNNIANASVSEDGTSVTFSLSIAGGYKNKIVVSSIGSTTSTLVDNYLANPVDAPDITAWPEQVATDMNETIGETLPFYGGSYAYAYDDERDYYGYASFMDYKVGNIVEDYGEKLENAGYTLISEITQTDSSDNLGYVCASYQKVLMEDDFMRASYDIDVIYESGCALDDDNWTDGIYEAQYPNGIFQINFGVTHYVTNGEMNDCLYDLAESNGFDDFPTVDFTADTLISYSDQTYIYSIFYGYNTVIFFDGEFADEDTAIAQFSPWIDALVEYGFVSNDDTASIENGDRVSYTIYNDDYMYYVDLEINSEGAWELFVVVDENPYVSWEDFCTWVSLFHEYTSEIPEVSASGMAETDEVVFVDNTEMIKEYYPEDEIVFYGYFILYYDDLDAANAAGNAYANACLTNGFADSYEGTYTLASDGMLYLGLDKTEDGGYYNYISLFTEEEDDGSGALEIMFQINR